MPRPFAMIARAVCGRDFHGIVLTDRIDVAPEVDDTVPVKVRSHPVSGSGHDHQLPARVMSLDW
jgi:hypothetical protein